MSGPGGPRQLTFLAPAGCPAQDQARVALKASLRARPSRSMTARTLALDQHTRRVDELED